MFRNVWEFKVRFGETDAAGIVYYPNFYQWMNQSTHELFEAIQFPVARMLSIKRGIPLVEAHCQFRAALYFDDWVKVVSTVADVKNKVFKIEHEFYRGEELIADGYEVRVWVEFSEGRLSAKPIPEEIRHKLLLSHKQG